MTTKEQPRRLPNALARFIPAAPGMPRSVMIATMLMYIGAGLTAVSLIATLASSSAMRSAVRTTYPHWTAARVSSYVRAEVTLSLIQVVLEIALWLFVAWACRTGRPFGRMLGTGLFILNTLLVVLYLVSAGFAAGLAFTVLLWLVGLATVALLWRNESSAYFTPALEPARPARPMRAPVTKTAPVRKTAPVTKAAPARKTPPVKNSAQQVNKAADRKG